MKAIFLETDRLLLRKFQESDFADFCALVMDPQRNRMMGNDEIATEEDARALFDWFLHKEKRAYALVLKNSGKVVGNLTVYDEPPEEIRTRAELAGKKGRSLSFSLSPQYRRQGLMLEALRAVIDHLFTAENVEYINDGFSISISHPGRCTKSWAFKSLPPSKSSLKAAKN